MDDQVLGLLRFGFLGLLYLFFGRVMWAVWNQVRPVAVTVVRVLQPPRLAGELDLSTGPLTIGRHPDCDLALPDDGYLSQQHLRLGRDAAGPWVEDLGSTNGTFVDGDRVTGRQWVRSGMRISAGSVLLEAR